MISVFFFSLSKLLYFSLADEIDIFEGVVGWARASLKKTDAKGEELYKAIGDLWPLIRFPTMTAKDLAAKVVPLNLFASPTVLALFQYVATAEAGGKPSLPDSLKMFSTTKRKSSVELRWASTLIIADRTITSTGTGWRSVRGAELWASGVNECTFVMKTRGYSSGTSIICGIAPDTIALDSQYPGYTTGLGAGIGDQGSTFGGATVVTTSKKPSGRYFDENEEVRIVYDQGRGILSFFVNKNEICSFSGVFGSNQCPVVSLYGTSVVEWID